MIRYAYRAIDETGSVVKGILKMPNETSLKIALEGQKFRLIHAKPARIQSKFKKPFTLSLPLMEEFCLQMATFNQARLTILQSLELLRDATQNNNLKQSLIQIIHVFQSGLTLSKSFATIPYVFDDIFCSIVSSGEQTGDLAITFDQLAKLFKWRHGLNNQIWKSLQYPLILSVVVLVLIGLMFTWTIPQMADFFHSLQKELPFSTQFLILISQHSTIIIQMISVIILIIGLMILSLRFLSTRGTLKIHQIYLKLPLIGKMVKKVDLHRFLQVFISLTKANVTLIAALESAIKNIQNLYLQHQLNDVRQDVLKGYTFSQSWHRQLELDPLIGRLILTGEHTGQLSQTLDHSIDFLKRDIDQFSKKVCQNIRACTNSFFGSGSGMDCHCHLFAAL